ncbi:redox-sensitive transcriptional activator SoxR [Vibrio zhugei]|uniref:Redox-sensitive transcriptional activator SoxR n=1 Tax=Vibrio zhugei TaxID=2479546 RepID=A0ABV7CE32_9VIBR|nr:redox-sensitive transcriptional activator SoxR [Vibrio zhugei]
MEMSVGEVAKRTGVSVATLHFYEEKGLIFSTRNAGNQRRYQRAILRRIAVIKAAQQVGLTLQEIVQALEILPKHKAPTAEQWQTLSQAWHTLLENRITSLKMMQNQLGSCIQCGCLSLEHCALYNPEDKHGIYQSGAKLIHHQPQES